MNPPVTTLLVGAAAAPVPAAPAASTAAVVPVMPRAFTGYAFDACQAPSQADMDVWRTSSPFWGVGVYVAGANRLCDVQPNLNATWVSTQARVGPRAAP